MRYGRHHEAARKGRYRRPGEGVATAWPERYEPGGPGFLANGKIKFIGELPTGKDVYRCHDGSNQHWSKP